MFGGFALLAVMMFVSQMDRRAWWSYPNLLSAYFYGGRSIGRGVGWSTVAGIALQLMIAAAAGALFGGVFTQLFGARRLVLPGLVWGVLVFYASEQFYRIASPVVVAYLPRGAALVAHMIYGVCLAGLGLIGVPPAQVTTAAGTASERPGFVRRPVVAAALPNPVESERAVRAPEEIPQDEASIASPSREDPHSPG